MKLLGGWLDEPRARGGVRGEEPEEELCHLLSARLRRVRAVGARVLAAPDQPVLASLLAVRPEVRPPTDPRPPELAGDPVGDQPLDAEAAVVGKRLRFEGRRRVAAVGAAGDVDELEVREADVENADDRSEVGLQPLRVRRERVALPGDRFLEPDGLDLRGRRAGSAETLVDDGPEA